MTAVPFFSAGGGLMHQALSAPKKMIMEL